LGNLNTKIPLFIPNKPYAGLHELPFGLSPEDKVLDIGGGQNSLPRANVVVEKFPEDNSQRLGRPMSVRPWQQLVIADAAKLPFEDKSFKLAFSSHVMEHIEDIASAIDEMNRVADYIFAAYPKGDFDMFTGRKSFGHVNLLSYMNGKLYIKKRHPEQYSEFFGWEAHHRWPTQPWNQHWEINERWVWEDRIFIKTPLIYEVVENDFKKVVLGDYS
jgi:hypothetical protein